MQVWMSGKFPKLDKYKETYKNGDPKFYGEPLPKPEVKVLVYSEYSKYEKQYKEEEYEDEHKGKLKKKVETGEYVKVKADDSRWQWVDQNKIKYCIPELGKPYKDETGVFLRAKQAWRRLNSDLLAIRALALDNKHDTVALGEEGIARVKAKQAKAKPKAKAAIKEEKVLPPPAKKAKTLTQKPPPKSPKKPKEDDDAPWECIDKEALAALRNQVKTLDDAKKASEEQASTRRAEYALLDTEAKELRLIKAKYDKLPLAAKEMSFEALDKYKGYEEKFQKIALASKCFFETQLMAANQGKAQKDKQKLSDIAPSSLIAMWEKM